MEPELTPEAFVTITIHFTGHICFHVIRYAPGNVGTKQSRGSL